MDWPTFFEKNSQSLFTLAGVFLGSLITFFISYLNNIFQSRERDKDRAEQRREAKIHTREKWMERDILKIMDSIEKLLNLLAETARLGFQIYILKLEKNSGLLSEEDFKAQKTSLYHTLPKHWIGVNQTRGEIGRLVNSFDEDSAIILMHEEFQASLMELLIQRDEITRRIYFEEPVDETDADDVWKNVLRNAGKFQKSLREKLISIRES